MEQSNQSMQSVLDRGVESGFGLHVQLNAPEFFQRKDFLEYLESSEPQYAVMTWHTSASGPSEWSDTIVLVEPCLNGEGSNSDLPEDIWDTIISALRSRFGDEGQFIPRECKDRHIAVRITNLDI